jgi:uncharacterized protein (TIGR03118 family)
MSFHRSSFSVTVAAVSAFFLLSVLPTNLAASTIYTQTNLVSDVPGLAVTLDPNLKNPWGVSFAPTSPFWVSNQGTNTSTLYDGAGNIVPLVVAIPPIGMPQGPTGQVFNGTNDFGLADGSPASFLFATLDGQIQGWNGGEGTTAVNVATTAGAIYTGLANGNVGNANFLYAADNTGHINVFDRTFQNVTSTMFAGKFTDPNALPGFNPYNIQNINGNLFVTYADVPHGVAQPGGFVDEYDSSGNLMKRIATGGSLFAPWGITLAPAGFGSFGGDLLIGQFGSGEILIFDPTTDQFLGTLDGRNGPIVNDGLWALDFRTGGANTNPNDLYFTAGINGEADGLFGSIAPAPEPGTLSLMFGTVSALGARFLVRSRRRSA